MNRLSDALAAPRIGMSHATVAIALSLLLGIQPAATDLYLPTLPTIKSDLGTTMAAAQRTLSALILAFGFGQLFWGPVADRFGRRPVMLIGLGVFTAASLGGALAGDIQTLVWWRVLQGLGVASSVVCARSMVRDLYEPHEGVHVLSLGMSGLGLIAIAGPLLGATLALHFSAIGSWRVALAILTVFGSATLAYVFWRIEESIRQRQPTATQLRPMLRNGWQIVRHPTFIAYTCLTAGTYAGLYTFLSTSSFVLIEGLGLPRLGYAAVLACGAFTYLLGTFGCRIWLARHGIRGAVKRGAFITLAGGMLMAGLSLAGVHSVWAIVIPQVLYACGHGVHQACGQAGVVGPFPTRAGAASALSGFILSAIAFGMGQGLGELMNRTGHSPFPMTLSMGAWGIFTAIVGWTLVQRHGEPHSPAFQGALK